MRVTFRLGHRERELLLLVSDCQPKNSLKLVRLSRRTDVFHNANESRLAFEHQQLHGAAASGDRDARPEARHLLLQYKTHPLACRGVHNLERSQVRPSVRA